MTALDRAIIKAYHRPTSRSGTAVMEPPAAAPRVAASRAVPLSRALADLAAVSAAPSTNPPATIAAEPTPSSQAAAMPATDPPCVAATTAPVGPSISALLDAALHAATVAAQSPSPTEIGEATVIPTAPIAMTSPLPPALASQSVTTSPAPSEDSWRPLLQVDRVIWPSISDRLQTTAPAAIEQMIQGLLAVCASGSKVLGLASCAAGEGVTTLLLAAARKLLSQGRKVVLVDANWSHPQLAQSLGLLPQIGWEETLGGGLPLEEVVIESLEDGLAVLPVRDPSANTIAQGQVAASLEILAREFDVVLVDLGPLAQAEGEDDSAREVTARMDAVILVQNVRVTTPNRLADVRARLAASNLRHAGTIQNFVAG